MAYSCPYGLGATQFELKAFTNHAYESGYSSANHSREASYELSREKLRDSSHGWSDARAMRVFGHQCVADDGSNKLRSVREQVSLQSAVIDECLYHQRSPTVYGHKYYAKSMSGGGVTSPKQNQAGRQSPGNDLGYHTLLSHCSPLSSPCSSNGPAPQPMPRTITHAITTTARRKLLSPSCAAHSHNSIVAPPIDGNSSARDSATSRTDIHALSDSQMLRIFSYMRTDELGLLSRVCRRWYLLVWEPKLWQSLVIDAAASHTRFDHRTDHKLRHLLRLLCKSSVPVAHSVRSLVLRHSPSLTDYGLSSVVRRCHQLRHIDLQGCLALSNRAVHEIMSQCRHLQKLDVSGCTNVTCIDVAPQTGGGAASFPLTSLNMSDCFRLSDAGLKAVLRSCPQLQYLYLRRCRLLTDHSLHQMAAHCSRLREISVCECWLITDSGVTQLSALGTGLRYLSVSKCERVSDASLCRVASCCHKLRYLNARGCPLVGDPLLVQAARSCDTHLQALDVGDCDVTDRGVRLLAEGCRGLRRVGLRGCTRVTDEGVQCLAYLCPSLIRLNLQNCAHLSRDTYSVVKRCCKRCVIEHTELSFC